LDARKRASSNSRVKTDSIPRACALAAVALSVALVVALAVTLPVTSATNIAASGSANGGMSRAGFAALMLALCAGLPLALLFGLSELRASPRPSVPARGRYTAPRAKSAPAIGPWSTVACTACVSAFMDFVAWRVWLANQPQPTSLSVPDLVSGAAVFVAFMAAWGVSVAANRH